MDWSRGAFSRNSKIDSLIQLGRGNYAKANWMFLGNVFNYPADICLFKDNNGNAKQCVKSIHSDNEETRIMSRASFWFLYYQLWTAFTHCSGVSIVKIEKTSAGWLHIQHRAEFEFARFLFFSLGRQAVGSARPEKKCSVI